jgi:hypothetical protein
MVTWFSVNIALQGSAAGLSCHAILPTCITPATNKVTLTQAFTALFLWLEVRQCGMHLTSRCVDAMRLRWGLSSTQCNQSCMQSVRCTAPGTRSAWCAGNAGRHTVQVPTVEADV